MAGKDYEVGYGKPPSHSQWRKGQSGNPKGKPKGARGLKGDLDRVLRKVLTIEGRGTKLKGTTQSLALEMLARRAASGDVRSIKAMIELVLTIFGSGDRGGDRERLSEGDQRLLDEWVADLDQGPAELEETLLDQQSGSTSETGADVSSDADEDAELQNEEPSDAR